MRSKIAAVPCVLLALAVVACAGNATKGGEKLEGEQACVQTHAHR